MRYTKPKNNHLMHVKKTNDNYHPQYIHWTQNRIVHNALAKGWHVVVQKMGKRKLVTQ
ncbi:hypothetical protein [Cysteiniphilum sp. JM-1]|uniref:hypothetical protein n=1 Tax=Cysteiniphilum sp. JM-1 TaxID=2610891 RepID=UPI00168D3F84|nr:hypothetical protein [Cysteiniphilum sp. JM-1]